jgi:hypothetical protein
MRKLLIGGVGAGALASAAVIGLTLSGGTAAASGAKLSHAWHGKAVTNTASTSSAQSAPAAQAPATSSKGSDDKTISFIAHQTDFTAFDLGNDNFGPGDYFVFRERDKSGSKTVGHDTVVCHVNFGNVVDCAATFVSSKGQITLAGEVPDSNKFELAITGGTDAYKNATGQGNLRNLANGDTAIDLHLG